MYLSFHKETLCHIMAGSLMQVYAITCTVMFSGFMMVSAWLGLGHQETKMRIACFFVMVAAFYNACECIQTALMDEPRMQLRVDFVPILWSLPLMRILCMIPIALTSGLTLSVVSMSIYFGMVEVVQQFSVTPTSFSSLWDSANPSRVMDSWGCYGFISCQGMAIAQTMVFVMLLVVFLWQVPYVPWATVSGMLELLTSPIGMSFPFEIIPLVLCDMSMMAATLSRQGYIGSTLLFICSMTINILILLYALLSIQVRANFLSVVDHYDPKRKPKSKRH